MLCIPNNKFCLMGKFSVALFVNFGLQRFNWWKATFNSKNYIRDSNHLL